MISNRKNNCGFIHIIFLLLIILGLSVFFLYSKLPESIDNIDNKDNKADIYKNVYYTPFPSSNTNGQYKKYPQHVYLISKDSNQEIISGEVLPSKYLLGPVLPTLDSVNSKIYFASGESVFEYDIRVKSKKEIYNAGKDFTINYLEVSKSHSLYITQSKVGKAGKNTSMILVDFDLQTNLYKLIGSQDAVLYGVLKVLGKTLDNTVVGTFGGDGCGGYGEIYTIKDEVNNLLMKTGGGCDRSPRYLGFSDDLKSIVTVTPKGQYEFGSSEVNEFVYLTDINTGNKKAIFDLTKLDKPIRSLIKSSSDDYVYLVSQNNDKVYKLDLNSYVIVNETLIDNSLQRFHISNIKTDDTILFELWSGYVGDKKQYKVLNLETGSVSNPYTAPTAGSIDSIGLLNGQIVVVDYDY